MGNISYTNDQEIFKVLKAKLVEMERAEVDLKTLQSQIDAVRAKQEQSQEENALSGNPNGSPSKVKFISNHFLYRTVA